MMDSLEKNKKLAQKAAQIWETGNLDSLNDFYTSDCIHHQQNEHQNIDLVGLEAWKNGIKAFLQKYPNYKETIVDQIAENDKVVTIVSCQATNISWSGVVVDKISDGKIRETWVWFKRNNPLVKS